MGIWNCEDSCSALKEPLSPHASIIIFANKSLLTERTERDIGKGMNFQKALDLRVSINFLTNCNSVEHLSNYRVEFSCRCKILKLVNLQLDYINKSQRVRVGIEQRGSSSLIPVMKRRRSPSNFRTKRGPNQQPIIRFSSTRSLCLSRWKQSR